MLKDYSRSFPHHAIFLPSIPPVYARFAHSGSFKRPMVVAPQDLNFLDPDNRLFFYPWALYSAGQAANNNSTAKKRDDIVSNRNRSITTILGDSGGFQIATDKISWAGAQTAQRVMRWMEDVADYSMTLDFPTGAIESGVIRKHRDQLIAQGVDLQSLNAPNRLGLDYNTCLHMSCENNQYFVTHQQAGKTIWLNVLQGRNETESAHWYDSVKRFPFTSWAFAGQSSKNLATTLRRIIAMRDEGRLDACKWMHFLGVGELGRGVLYSTIKQSIHETTGYDIGFSFDASSPFQTAGRGTVYTGFLLDRTKWSFAQSNFRKEASSSNAETLLDYCAEISRWRLENSDKPFLERPVMGTNAFVGGSTIAGLLKLRGAEEGVLHDDRLDASGYVVIMNHNIHVMVDAHRMAQKVFFEGIPSQIPNSLRVADEVIRQVFKTGSPYTLIDDCERELDFAWR